MHFVKTKYFKLEEDECCVLSYNLYFFPLCVNENLMEEINFI